MKNKKVIRAIFAIVLVVLITTLATSCQKTSNSIVGTWADADNEEYTITFSASGTVTSIYDPELAFYETLDNGRLILMDVNHEAFDDDAFYYLIVDDTLYIDNQPLTEADLDGDVYIESKLIRIK